MKKDANGKYILYNLDNDQTLQEGEGIFDTLKNVGMKVAEKLTGKAAKEIAKKAATKAVEKGAEQIGDKTGKLIGEKIYNKFTKTDNFRQPQVTQSIKEDNLRQPQITQSHKEDKGEQLMKELQKDKKSKSKWSTLSPPTNKSKKEDLFDDFDELFL